TMRHKADVAQDNHFVVAGDLLERAVQVLVGVLVIAREPLLVGAHDAGRCIQQSFAARIVAGPADERPHGLLGLGAGGTVERSAQFTGDDAGASWVQSYKRVHARSSCSSPTFSQGPRSASGIGCKWGAKVPGAEIPAAVGAGTFAAAAASMNVHAATRSGRGAAKRRSPWARRNRHRPVPTWRRASLRATCLRGACWPATSAKRRSCWHAPAPRSLRSAPPAPTMAARWRTD